MSHPSGASRGEQVLQLAERLGVRFRDPRILERALVHGSYAHEEASGDLESYERLEFLGDAVLNLVVSDHLYRRFPAAREGELARMRARLVSEPTLADIARSLDLGRYILLGKGEERSGKELR